MGKFLFTIILLFVVGSAACQPLGFSINDGQHKVKIPIEIQNNLIIIPVILNNQLPLKFILDTGVRTTILTEKTYSDILQLEYTKKYSISGPGGEKLIEAYITNNVSIDLPGVHGEGHTMLVLETDYLELRNFLGTDIHGVLGYEIFSRFIVEIDYSNKLLVLTQAEKFRPSRKYQQLRMVVEDTKPYVFTQVNMDNSSARLDLKLLVDSGASHGLILEPETNTGIRVPKKNLESVIGRGLGGIITGRVGRIKSLKLGKYSIDNPIANFPDINSYNDTLKIGYNTSRNGALGGEVLSRFNIIFDFPHEKLYVKKNHDFKKNFYFNMSGLNLKAIGASLRKYEISEVRKNSPGERADVKVGDQLITINGLIANDLELNNINGYFNSKPNRKITLEIIRNGVKLKKSFRLESQI